MVTFLSIIAVFYRAIFIGKQALILENLALRQQLGVYSRKTKLAKVKISDRIFWVLLSQLWDGWKSSLVIVKPDTVIGWHRQGFRLYWRWRSRTNKVGRPRIRRKHIEFIKRMSRESPDWGEDKIYEELKIKFGVEHSTSTIRRYMVSPRNPTRGQTWWQFIDNHKGEIFARDFLTQYMAFITIIDWLRKSPPFSALVCRLETVETEGLIRICLDALVRMMFFGDFFVFLLRPVYSDSGRSILSNRANCSSTLTDGVFADDGAIPALS